jgi:hypothetical protein
MNYINHKLIIISILGLSTYGHSQGLPPIQLDRPDQTECSFIVPKGYIQVESGLAFEKENALLKNYTYPSLLWKYGINDMLECRLITEHIATHSKTQILRGIAPITVGFKANLLKEMGLLPMVSFIGHLTTQNIGNEAFRTAHPAPSFRFTMQHTLSEKITLSYNLGAEWDGETPQTTYLYTLSTGFALSKKWGCYTELYGFLPQANNADHRADAGFTYLINNDWILDFSSGVGLSPDSPRYYAAFGVSHRFRVR